MITKIKNMNFKNLRKELMIVVNTVDKLQGSRELSLVKTQSQRAMMWCGNYLKYSGEGANPYAGNDGKRKNKEDIKPMFDATESTLHENVLSEGQIFVVDQLRQILAKKLDEVITVSSEHHLKMSVSREFESNDISINDCLSNIRNGIAEARMWLGMELGRLRDA